MFIHYLDIKGKPQKGNDNSLSTQIKVGNWNGEELVLGTMMQMWCTDKRINGERSRNSRKK